MKTIEPETKLETRNRLERHSRIRRAKQLLRPLPRRATLHRYPIIKFFAANARKKPYLWSFRSNHVTPAIYIGCILAFLPAYGVQLPLAFLAAFFLRTNLLVASALQFITNPLTLFPIYAFTYAVGKTMIDHWGLGEVSSLVGSKAYPLVIGGLFVGLISGLALDLIYRLTANRKSRKGVNVKRMLKKPAVGQAPPQQAN